MSLVILHFNAILDLVYCQAFLIVFRKLFDNERIQLVEEVERLRHKIQKLDEELSEKIDTSSHLENELRSATSNLRDTKNQLGRIQESLAAESHTGKQLAARLIRTAHPFLSQ